ncbi:hypothetical protein V8B55DRAFT_1536723 [Mucor lusitanicus]|uniref:Ribosomal lysine N-methyltransferase 4 n=2 Tax=Mucor circinelloides f. lusitanicus TaxID=29924 RepID=A0A162R8B1_MUCCL|nr:hypothetical protein FB192DRAFT_1380397 [Mucor lusitanicus]OAD09210.1 hypothetical protein MUCCIDRAFT_106194 [Mucor lusitanicus CBS 277.49]
MATFEETGNVFWKWLQDNGTTLSKDIAIKDYRSEGAGRGVIATNDIKEGELLFSLPRSILLSPFTSSLNQVEGLKDDLAALNGWTPLIITLMYESQKEDSFWKPYFDVLPRQFSTPMFWEEADLKELQGTDIVSKLGKAEAEDTFENEVKPIIEKYPSLFDKDVHTLELFHICGSLIMAYSFNDELQKTEEKSSANDNEQGEDQDEEEEEEEEQQVITMVPMADMLNHKTGFNNARLFHEADSLQMKAIKDIKQGEQIYNTYGDLCNADLLRKYGFTDEKNEFDLVELDGPLVVEHCNVDQKQDEELIERKIDFLMEEGVLDECFVIDTEHEIPLELIVSVHVLCSTPSEFEKMEEKQKLPKPRLTQDVKDIILNILKKRLSRYPTTLEEDKQELKDATGNRRNALLVRMGEKNIIEPTIQTLSAAPVVAAATATPDKRPSNAKNDQGKNKKQKRH